MVAKYYGVSPLEVLDTWSVYDYEDFVEVYHLDREIERRARQKAAADGNTD